MESSDEEEGGGGDDPSNLSDNESDDYTDEDSDEEPSEDKEELLKRIKDMKKVCHIPFNTVYVFVCKYYTLHEMEL